MRKSTARGVLTALAMTLINTWVLAEPLGAEETAGSREMSLYTRIGTLNVCIFRAAGVPFDKATAIAGETVAQIIKGAHASRISETGNNALSIDELRRGAINSVVLGSVEVCPDEVPLAIREKVKNVLTARSENTYTKSPDEDVLNQESSSRDTLRNQQNANATYSETTATSIAPARLAASITVRIETAGPSGSGTIISKRGNNYSVATACHVLDGSSSREEVRIITNDGANHQAVRSSVIRHKGTDLCSIEFASNKTYITPQLSSKRADVGETVYVSGWSLSGKDIPSSLRAIEGMITGSTQMTGQDGYSLIYTTSAPTLPGMSGGPIISQNQLIGIHGRAERAPDILTDGKVMATAYSLGLSINLLD